MKKQCIVVATFAVIFFLSVLGATAQGPGPQGVGAQEAAQKSDSPHSYNPIKWIKKDKDSSATTEKPKRAKNKNLQRSLQPRIRRRRRSLDHDEYSRG